MSAIFDSGKSLLKKGGRKVLGGITPATGPKRDQEEERGGFVGEVKAIGSFHVEWAIIDNLGGEGQAAAVRLP